MALHPSNTLYGAFCVEALEVEAKEEVRADEYYHIGDTEMDRGVADQAGFQFISAPTVADTDGDGICLYE